MHLWDNNNKIAFVAGTRPEIIKLYPIMKLLDEQKLDYTFIFSGQHYSFDLFTKFIKEFNIKTPDYFIDLNKPKDTITQFSNLVTELGNILTITRPSSIVVVGDTNSVLAAALAASKLKIPVIHVEAGLRSYDWNMQEEYNRRITDHISDLLFAPTNESALTLENEKIQGEIKIVGNTVIDAIRICLESSMEKSHLLNEKTLISDKKIDPESKNYVLLTLHREENVNDPKILEVILQTLSEFDLEIIFPIHPHTFNNIHKFGLDQYIKKNITVIDPAGYSDFLRLMKNCQFVITDSGGVQEEITSPQINKKALVLRNSTERYESILSGHAILCSVEYLEIKNAIKNMLSSLLLPQSYPNVSPYGDGYAAEKILEVLKEGKFVPLSQRILLKRIDIMVQ
jgi:UDP-N-acetylglucosamine 2-epimerase (non-hydrolysing)